jgi:hypothetical protein
MGTTDNDWTKPAMMAIPKEGYFELERGRYGPIFPKLRLAMGLRSSPRSSPVARRPSVSTAKRWRLP